MARGFKFRIKVVEGLYYLYSEKQRRFAASAKLICVFVFAFAKSWFSHDAAQLQIVKTLIRLGAVLSGSAPFAHSCFCPKTEVGSVISSNSNICSIMFDNIEFSFLSCMLLDFLLQSLSCLSELFTQTLSV